MTRSYKNIPKCTHVQCTHMHMHIARCTTYIHVHTYDLHTSTLALSPTVAKILFKQLFMFHSVSFCRNTSCSVLYIISVYDKILKKLKYPSRRRREKKVSGEKKSAASEKFAEYKFKDSNNIDSLLHATGQDGCFPLSHSLPLFLSLTFFISLSSI